jgi:hypothetical protein
MNFGLKKAAWKVNATAKALRPEEASFLRKVPLVRDPDIA